MSADDHRVHGPEGAAVRADWPALTGAEVAHVLAQYPQAGAMTGIAWHSPRPLSAAAVVQTEADRVFVKRHHRRVRSQATLGEEHAFIAHLTQRGAHVPAVLRHAAGGSVLVRGEWTFEVHACAPGIDLYRELESWQPLVHIEHAHQAGMALAHLHGAAAEYPAGQRTTHLLVTRDELVLAEDPIATLASQLTERPGLADYLRHVDWRRALATAIVPRQQAVRARALQQPRLWTHNDWHASNLAWSSHDDDAYVTAAFDFGLASPTFALFDLATAIERNAIAWLRLGSDCDIACFDTARALIRGYAAVRPLGGAQRELLADLLPVVHIDFALSELEYFHAVTGSRHNADLAWNAFLLGHAAWFDSAPARALQDTIACG